MSNLLIAMGYLRQGLSIIPLVPHSKQPNSLLLPNRVDENGRVVIDKRTGKPQKTWAGYVVNHATEREVQRWFSLVPKTGIAILTGATSGVIVLDIDGPDGEKWVRNQGGVPRTPTTRTRRGRHVWLKHPGFTVRNFAHKAPAIDMRGDGGYVCVYPSIHPSGFPYTWITGLEVPFAPVPEWLMELIKPKQIVAATKRLPVSSVTNGTGYGLAALRSEVREVANTQIDRNNRLYRAALKLGSLVAAGMLSEADVINELMTAAASSGLSADDGESQSYRTITSGINKGMESPREKHQTQA